MRAVEASVETRLVTALRGAGPVRSRDLEAAGISRTQISRLVAKGRLQKIGHGLYTTPGNPRTEHTELVPVAKRAPQALFCLLTALTFHGLTTQSPSEVWIAIDNKKRPPRLDYPPLRTLRFSAASLHHGVEIKEVDGVALRVTNPAKTVADCFKFRNKIGLGVALEALRDARREGKAPADDLWRYATVNRVANVMRPYLEAVS